MKKQTSKQIKKVLSVLMAVTLLTLAVSVGFSFSVVAADEIDPAINELVSYTYIDFKDSENVAARDGQGVYIPSSPISGSSDYATKYEDYYKYRVAGWCKLTIQADPDEAGDNMLVGYGNHDTMALGSVYRLNQNGKLLLAKPSSGYAVTIRYRVVNNHNTGRSHQTILKLGYGSTIDNTRKDDVYRNMGPDTMSAEIATLALCTDTSTTSFSSTDENGVTTQKEYGTWYTQTYCFATPAEFPTDKFLGHQPQHLVLFTRLGTNARYEIDYIEIKECSIVRADLKGGKGTSVSSGNVGDLIDLGTPTRDGYEFDGWFLDEDYTTPFTQTHFTAEGGVISVYAKWKNAYATYKVDFYDYPIADFSSAVMQAGNGGSFVVKSSSSRNYLTYNNKDGYIDSENQAFIPLYDANGPIRLKPNTDYAISFDYTMATIDGKSGKATISFFTASSEDANDGRFAVPKSNHELAYAWNYTDQYLHLKTGEIEDGKDALYLRITAKDNILYYLAFGYFKIYEVGSETGFYYANDTLNDKMYQLVGKVGDDIPFPELGETVFYEQDGWFNDEGLSDRNSGKFEQGVRSIYLRWKFFPLDFENYFQSDKMYQYHTFGEDCAIVDSGDSHGNVLSYDFKYVPNYLKATSNAVSLSVINDKVTYKITYDYKVEYAKGDVDIEFFTAHRNARWAFLNQYKSAVYTVRASEAGQGWKTATVYFTADLSCHGSETYDKIGDGLFISFNPTVLDDAKILVDNVKVTPFDSTDGVVVFLDKNGKTFTSVSGAVGKTVNAPTSVPQDYMSAFEGWYTNAALTNAFSGTTITAGTTLVYSKFTDGVVNFDGNLYGDANVVGGKFAPANNAETKIGEVENNKTYLVTFDYTAPKNASVAFFTADAYDKTKNATNKAEATFELAETASVKQGKAIFTTGFAYLESENQEDLYGNNLYIALTGGATIDNITITEVSVLSQNGSAVLTEQAEETENAQALRFFFGYKSQNAADIEIGGEKYSLVERGIVLKNANNSVTGVKTENGTVVYPATLKKAKDGTYGYTYKGKTYGFVNCWEVDSKTGEIVYSTYLKGLTKDDTRLTSARGYLVIKDKDGNLFTVYSEPEDTSVTVTKKVLAEYTTVKNHTINGANWNRYTIVHPRIMSYIYGEKIEELVAFAKERSVNFARVTDNTAEKEQEILIGDTSRDISKQVTVSGENNYIIKVIGNKVVIKGGSDIATRQALIDLISMISRKEELGCGINLYDGYVLTGEYKATSSDYALTFGDEFEDGFHRYWYGNAGDSGSYWESSLEGRYGTGKGIGGSPVKLKNSGEIKELVTIREGSAVLGTSYIEPTSEKDIEKKVSFAESHLSTIGKMLYQYGILEFKVKLAGFPTTNSLWVNGEVGNKSGGYKRGCFTEYDMLENFGNNKSYGSNLHYWWVQNRNDDIHHIDLATKKLLTKHRVDYYPIEGETDMTDEYHIFTLIWTDKGVKFAFDGVSYCTYTSPDWYKEAMPNYIIISAGLGDASYGPKFDAENHDEYYETFIDYVRLYQVKDMGAFIYDVENDRKY